MYDWPEVRWATDALWDSLAQRLRDAGIAAPAALDRSRPPERVWRDPGLVFGQTCGYPLVTTLWRRVALIAIPRYGVEGCDGAAYSSMIVVRADDPAAALADLDGRTAAINDAASLSGMLALRAAVADLGPARPVFADVRRSGSHRASMAMVAAGEADVCAVDAVCWALAQRHEPAAAALRVIGRSPMMPALPFIAARATSPQRLAGIRAALVDVLGDGGLADVRRALFLEGCVVADADAYRPVVAMSRRAAAPMAPAARQTAAPHARR
ncbi:MAG: PhnD/SsuA/transferrin family substrate-binding protein [Alphaproteobacteria bacterium]